MKYVFLEFFQPAFLFKYLDLSTLMTHTSSPPRFLTLLLLFSQPALPSFILKNYKGSCNQSLPCFSLPFQQLLHSLA